MIRMLIAEQPVALIRVAVVALVTHGDRTLRLLLNWTPVLSPLLRLRVRAQLDVAVVEGAMAAHDGFAMVRRCMRPLRLAACHHWRAAETAASFAMPLRHVRTDSW